MLKIVEYTQNNDFDNVKKCLEKDNTLSDSRDENSKFTLLMICSKKGYFDIAKLLVENGANINARSKTGITALMFACAEKQVRIAKYLIDSGADVNLRDRPLFSALLYASLTKEHEIIKALIEAGADVNAKNFKLVTPLMFASGINDIDTIKLVNENTIVETLPRTQLMQAQTPQAFKTSLIKDCYQMAKEQNFLATDDASLVEQFSKTPVKAVLGSYENIKITTPEDLK